MCVYHVCVYMCVLCVHKSTVVPSKSFSDMLHELAPRSNALGHGRVWGCGDVGCGDNADVWGMGIMWVCGDNVGVWGMGIMCGCVGIMWVWRDNVGGVGMWDKEDKM